MATPTITTFIRMREVRACAGITRSTIYRLMQRGEFPRCIKLAPNVSVWSSAEIDAWIAERIAERDGTPPEGAP